MKYANQENTVVYWQNDNGYHSASIEDKRVKAWLAEGNTPEPADPVPNPRIEQIKQELAALDQKKIRPLAEGDTVYLAGLNAQTLALREELANVAA